MTPEELQARLLYRDALMLILDKPAGLAVHAGGKGDNHLMQMLDGLRFGLPRAPELAHRLDRDTSGCLVLGRHRKALATLGALFAEGKVEKTYWAVVVGRPPAEQGAIDAPLKKLERRHGWRMVVDPRGQASLTEYRVLGGTDRLSWIEARPKTGRTHQIRVHLAAVGLPLALDPDYGEAAPLRDGDGRLLVGRTPLHAAAIEVRHPLRGDPLTVEAPLPADLAAALEALRAPQ